MTDQDLDGASGQSIMSIIADGEILHRRVHPDQIKEDGGISSGVFSDPEMSVDRAALRTPEESLAEHNGYGLVSFLARSARELNQEVVPVPELLNKAHAEVRGNKTKATRKRFVKASEWVRRPKTPPEAPLPSNKPQPEHDSSLEVAPE